MGGHELLGDWDVAKAVPMDWEEGTKWTVSVDLPQHSLIQYKYVVKTAGPDSPFTAHNTFFAAQLEPRPDRGGEHTCFCFTLVANGFKKQTS